jgi:hypothetical protein
MTDFFSDLAGQVIRPSTEIYPALTAHYGPQPDVPPAGPVPEPPALDEALQPAADLTVVHPFFEKEGEVSDPVRSGIQPRPVSSDAEENLPGSVEAQDIPADTKPFKSSALKDAMFSSAISSPVEGNERGHTSLEKTGLSRNFRESTQGDDIALPPASSTTAGETFPLKTGEPNTDKQPIHGNIMPARKPHQAADEVGLSLNSPSISSMERNESQVVHPSDPNAANERAPSKVAERDPGRITLGTGTLPAPGPGAALESDPQRALISLKTDGSTVFNGRPLTSAANFANSHGFFLPIRENSRKFAAKKSIVSFDLETGSHSGTLPLVKQLSVLEANTPRSTRLPFVPAGPSSLDAVHPTNELAGLPDSATRISEVISSREPGPGMPDPKQTRPAQNKSIPIPLQSQPEAQTNDSLSNADPQRRSAENATVKPAALPTHRAYPALPQEDSLSPDTELRGSLKPAKTVERASIAQEDHPSGMIRPVIAVQPVPDGGTQNPNDTASQSLPTTVRLTIGRIVVKAVPPAASAPSTLVSTRRPAPVSLGDYLARHRRDR